MSFHHKEKDVDQDASKREDATSIFETVFWVGSAGTVFYIRRLGVWMASWMARIK